MDIVMDAGVVVGMVLFFLLIARGIFKIFDRYFKSSNDDEINEDIQEIINYGNGVYYFEQTEDDFGKALSKFIAEHPELRLVVISGEIYDQEGYFVIFEP